MNQKVIHENEILVLEQKEPPKLETPVIKESSTTNDSSSNPLNTWFRQQGASKTLIPKVKQNDNYSKLPHIFTPEQKKRQLVNYETSFSSIPNINDAYASIRVQTPHLSSFYLKCIDDVIKSNLPKKLIRDCDDPREMKYVQNIPHLKYVTFGSGKSS